MSISTNSTIFVGCVAMFFFKVISGYEYTKKEISRYRNNPERSR